MNSVIAPTTIQNISTPLVFSYKGSATEGGIIDAAVFSESLQGFSEMVSAANRVLYNNRSDIRVVVKSDFKTGSFEFAIEVVQLLLEHSKSYIDTPTEVVSVVKYLGVGGIALGGIYLKSFADKLGAESATTVMDFLRKTKGEKVTLQDKTETATTVIHNTNIIVIPNEVAELIADKQVREGLEKFSKPVSLKGYDSISTKVDDKIVEEINKQDYFYFEAPSKSEFESDEPFEGRFIIIDAKLIGHGKWRVRHENSKKEFDVIIQDKMFLNDVKEEKISFVSGDRLHLRGSIKHDRTGRGLESSYSASSAKKLRRAPKKKQAKRDLLQLDLDILDTEN